MKIASQEVPVYLTDPNVTCKAGQDTINLALQILKSRLKDYSVALQSFEAVKDYLKLSLGLEEAEQFRCLWLNTQNYLIKDDKLFSGTINASHVYPREVVKRALEVNAAGVIFAHNHPSGHIEPSQADKEITQKLKQALSLFDIAVVDHIIIGGDSAYSFASRGLI